jgi:hypothetical protein
VVGWHGGFVEHALIRGLRLSDETSRKERPLAHVAKIPG